MPESKIVSIVHDGKFPSQYGGADGMMHVQMVTFEDGMSGQANSKEAVPPYKVGEVVEYNQNGDFQGIPKLKVKKLGQGGPGGFSGGGGRGKGDSAGQMVGAAIHDAVALVCHGKAKPLQGETLDNFLMRIGDQICQASMKLKAKYTPAATAPQPQQQQQPYQQGTGRATPQPQQQPHNPAPVHNAQGQPVPTQSAHQQPQYPTNSVPLPEDDDDVPF